MEKILNWDGVLIEPQPDMFQACVNTRSAPAINCACSSSNDVLEFLKLLEEPFGNSGILKTLPDKRINAIKQKQHEIIKVQTKTLDDILADANSPKYIDYLDIDVEGQKWRSLNH